MLERVSKDLGVLSDHRIKVFVCVEGKHDVSFLKRISKMLHAHDQSIPDLSNDERIAFCLLGGSSLYDWVQARYLRGFNRPEIHLCDKGTDDPPQYEAAASAVNARGDRSFACLTGKREIENYLHRDAIREARQIDVLVDDNNSVPEAVAEAVHNGARGVGDVWIHLAPERQKQKISAVKRWLNSEAADRMTLARLRERDPQRDLEKWLRKVSELCQ